MAVFRHFRNIVANVVGRNSRERELHDEVHGYLDLLTDEKVKNGMPLEQARREARMELGGVEQVKEQTRGIHSGILLETFWRDLRFTFRGLRKRPGFTTIVVLSLAMGIGANAAIFSLVDAIILRPLPVPHPSEVIAIDTAASRLTQFGNSSYLDYVDFCKRAKSFAGLAISQDMSAGLNAAGIAPDSKPQVVYGLLVSGNFFSTMQVRPVMSDLEKGHPQSNKDAVAFVRNQAPDGEKFVDTATNQVGPGYFSTMQIPVLNGREFAEKDTRKFPNVVMVNETFARNYLTPDGKFEKAIGRIVRLRDGGPIQIVGVVKDSNYGGPFGVPANPVFYTPYFQQGATQGTLHIRGDGDLSRIVPVVRREITALDTGIAPISIQIMSRVVSEQGLFMPRMVTLLCGAFGAVALSLAFIGLYGVVSFTAERRTQEIGIRMTLGAQRSTVLRMILANGLVLGIGLVIGLVGAGAATPLMRQMLVGVSPWDPTTYAAITLMLVAATVIASWIPANRATRVDPIAALRYE